MSKIIQIKMNNEKLCTLRFQISSGSLHALHRVMGQYKKIVEGALLIMLSMNDVFDLPEIE